MQSSSFTQLSNLDSNSAEYESIKPVAIETDKDSTNDDISSPISNSPGLFLDCLKDIGASNEFFTELGFMNESCFDDLSEVVDEVPEGNDSDSGSGSGCGSDITDQSYGSNFSVFDYYSTHLSPIMEEPESADYEDTKPVEESPSGYAEFENEDENEDEGENNLQNNSHLVSPCISFYSESFIPRSSCVSSIIVPVPLITNITSAFHKHSSKNAQQSVSYLDFSPSSVEKKPHKRAWAHICKWFHGRCN
ncbi:unnamed protein product [Ambrosiozyma monospora]|uniref:Unnamed protein product n=1 Tax=Ambrosiozyma monospora TaxID=43982 RepID=A0A9W6YWC4_AMBMO|nr:unnamed protein product [Ambrosiozyma monospora]